MERLFTRGKWLVGCLIRPLLLSFKAVKHDLVSGILLSGLLKGLDVNGTQQSTDFYCALVGSGHTKVAFRGPRQLRIVAAIHDDTAL